MVCANTFNNRHRIMRTHFSHEVVFLIAMSILALIGILNRYIFLESNLPALFVSLIIACVYARAEKIYRRGIIFFSISFMFFVAYSWLRLDNVWEFKLTLSDMFGVKSGFAYVLDLIIFYFLFILAALLYYRKPEFPIFLWFLISGYIVVFILRNSMDISGLQVGYNLSPGFVILTFVPFVYLKNSKRKDSLANFANVMLVLCISWLALIGARTAVVALLLFYATLRAWPLITRNRFRYYMTFFGLLALIATLTVFYLRFEHLDEAVLEDTGLKIFSKRLGTRTDIWMHLLYYIAQRPFGGYGTDQATSALSPVPFLEFSYHRDNLAAHSTYFDILYRLGIVGLFSFVLIIFSIWRIFWNGRKLWPVRVSGSFLLALLLFASTTEFLVFSTLPLRSGFAWIILGIGAGASLRAEIDRQLSRHDRMTNNSSVV